MESDAPDLTAAPIPESEFIPTPEEAAQIRARAMWEQLAHHFADELVERWHSEEDTSGWSLADWMGLSDEQYAAWVECRYGDVL